MQVFADGLPVTDLDSGKHPGSQPCAGGGRVQRTGPGSTHGEDGRSVFVLQFTKEDIYVLLSLL